MITPGSKSIGMTTADADFSHLPAYADNPQQVIDFLLSKVSALSTLVEGKADTFRLKTLIQFSDEAIRIQAENIALIGNVTFLDVWRDQTGAVTGILDPSLTRIRGGVIQTGQIISNNWGASAGSAFDLDDGKFWMGGSSAPNLYFDGSTLYVKGTLQAGSIITSSITLTGTGTALSTIESHALSGYDIQQALEVSGTTILKGVLQPDTTGAIAVGTITWNTSTGALTGGTGIAITQWGIIGAASGVAKFSINASTGAAVFSGSLSAATGSFAGSLSAVTGTFAGTLSAAGGNFVGTVNALYVVATSSQVISGGYGNAAIAAIPGDFFDDGFYGKSVSSNAALLHTTNGVALWAEELSGGGVGTAIVAKSADGTALDIRGPMIIDNSTQVANLNCSYLAGHAYTYFSISTHSHHFEDLTVSDTWTKIQTSTDGSTVASSIYVRIKTW